MVHIDFVESANAALFDNEEFVMLKTENGGLYFIPKNVVMAAAEAHKDVFLPTVDGMFAIGAHVTYQWYRVMTAKLYCYSMDGAYVSAADMRRYGALYAPPRHTVFMKTGADASSCDDRGYFVDEVTSDEDLAERFPDLTPQQRNSLRYEVDIEETKRWNHGGNDNFYHCLTRVLEAQI